MHVIVGQGQLDAVLQATPEDRRGFIEEAAGILKHRRRKEKTLRKLDAMQANLTRLSDLAGEIRRQLKPLGRQAEIAREAATIAAVVRDARARLLADEVVEPAPRARRRTAAASRSGTPSASCCRSSSSSTRPRSQRLEQAQVGDDVDRARSHALRARVRAGAPARPSTRSRGSASRCSARRPSTTDAAPSVTRAMIDDAQRRGSTSIREAVGDAASALDERHDGHPRRPRRRSTWSTSEIAAQSALVARVRPGDLQARRARPTRPHRGSPPCAARCCATRTRSTPPPHAATRPPPSSRASRPRPRPRGRARPTSTRRTSSPRRPCSRRRREIERLREELHAREREQRRPRRAHRRPVARARPEGRLGGARRVAASPACAGCSPSTLTSSPGFEAAIAAALGSLADAVLVDDRDAAYRALEQRRAPASWAASRSPLAERRCRRREPTRRRRRSHRRHPPSSPRPPACVGLLAEVLIADDLAAARAAEPALATTRAPGHGHHEGRHRRRPLRHPRRLGSRAEPDRAHRRARPRRRPARGPARRARALPLRPRRAAHHPRALEGAGEARARGAARVRRAARAAHRAAEPRPRAGRGRRTPRRRASSRPAANAEERVADAERAADEAKRRARAGARRAAAGARRDRPRRRARRAGAAREAEVEARLRLETAKERVRAEEARVARHGAPVRGRAAGRSGCRAPRRHPSGPARGRRAGSPTSLPAALALGRRARWPRPASRSAARRRSARAATRSCLQRAPRRRPRCASDCTPSPRTCTDSSCASTRRSCTSAARRAGRVGARPHRGRARRRVRARRQQIPSRRRRRATAPSRRPFVREEQQQRRLHRRRAQARPARPREPARPRGVRRARAAPPVPHRAAHRPREHPQGPADDHRGDRRQDGVDLPRRLRGHPRRRSPRCSPCSSRAASAASRSPTPTNMLTTGIEVCGEARRQEDRAALAALGRRAVARRRRAAHRDLQGPARARSTSWTRSRRPSTTRTSAACSRRFEDLRESSQLIVITHQKRTMEIADALYGVSMRQDGVSAVVGQRVREEREARAS